MSVAEDAAKKALADNPEIVSEWAEEGAGSPDDAADRESCVGFLSGYALSWARKNRPDSDVTFEAIRASIRTELHAHKRSTLQ